MIGSIASSGAPAVQAFQPAPPAPPPVATSSPEVVPLEVPGDADPCTSCGREALEQAYAMRAMEQGSVDAEVLAQVAAAYAANRG